MARRRSAVLWAAQGGCPCDRAFPAPGAPPSQVGHPAPHASSGLCRGLSHLGDPPDCSLCVGRSSPSRLQS